MKLQGSQYFFLLKISVQVYLNHFVPIGMCEVLKFVQSSVVHAKDEPALNKPKEPGLRPSFNKTSLGQIRSVAPQ